MDVYGAREDPVPGVSPARWSPTPSRCRRAGCCSSRPGRRPPRRWPRGRRPGDLVLTMGAGDVSMVGPEVLGGAARGAAEAGGPDEPASATGRQRRHDHPRPHRPVPPVGRAARRPRARRCRPAAPPARGRARGRTVRLPPDRRPRSAGSCRRRRGSSPRRAGLPQVDGWTASSLPADQVREAAGIAGAPRCSRSTSTPPRRGSPGCPRSPSVEVTRGWPRHRRDHGRGAGARAVVGGPPGRSLVDAEGVLFDTVTGEPPAGVVPLEVADPAPGDPATTGGARRVAALPADVRDGVVASEAHHGEDVSLTLDDGTTVVWGDASESDRQGDRARRAARADRRRRPRAGRDHRRQHPRTPSSSAEPGGRSRRARRTVARRAGRLPGAGSDTPDLATRPTRNISFRAVPVPRHIGVWTSA